MNSRRRVNSDVGRTQFRIALTEAAHLTYEGILVIDRRHFLRQSSLAALSFPSSVSSLVAQFKGHVTRPQRIIVVGGGLAGLCAAFELTDSGHDVVVVEAQTRPGGRVHTLREMFADGLHAEAGASRIPTTHALTIHYATLFGLPLVPFAPADKPDVRYFAGERLRVSQDTEFQWPSSVPTSLRQLTPPQVRRTYIQELAKRISNPLSTNWAPSSMFRYDEVTRDAFLRTQSIPESTIKLMSLGSTPVANLRSFLDLLHELAVGRVLARQSNISEERLLKIATGNDELPKAFASRLDRRVNYGAELVRIEQDARTVRAVIRRAGGEEVITGDRLVCTVPFTMLRNITIVPPFSEGKRKAIHDLKYHSATRIYLQSRTRYWVESGLSGFAETDLPMEIWDATYKQESARGITMSFFMGSAARMVAAMPAGQQLNFAVQETERVFPGILKNYDGGFVKTWDDDPWSRGAVAYLAPGDVQSLEPHIRTIEGRIHFAGEHASSLRGWMQGALESGLRVVREINALGS
ncbi:MAG: flavin monoamine oxidase family protein [Pyrinomonadaceae bacterium]